MISDLLADNPYFANNSATARKIDKHQIKFEKWSQVPDGRILKPKNYSRTKYSSFDFSM